MEINSYITSKCFCNCNNKHCASLLLEEKGIRINTHILNFIPRALTIILQ